MNSISNKKGIVVAIEGGEGVGKTTVLNQLKEKLSNALFVEEPFKESPHTVRIRDLIKEGKGDNSLEFVKLFAKARKDLNHSVLIPARESGKVVFSDRSIVSSLVYQLQDNTLTRNQIINLNIEEDPDFQLPDLVVLLDGDPKEFRKRMLANNREMDKNDSKPLDWHLNIRSLFIQLKEEESLPIPIIVVNSENGVDIEELIESINKELGVVLEDF